MSFKVPREIAILTLTFNAVMDIKVLDNFLILTTQNWFGNGEIWFGLFWFYDIVTILGYLMPHPLYTYIEYIGFVNILTFLSENKLILLHTGKRFQVLLCITNNSFKHQSFFLHTVK